MKRIKEILKIKFNELISLINYSILLVFYPIMIIYYVIIGKLRSIDDLIDLSFTCISYSFYGDTKDEAVNTGFDGVIDEFKVLANRSETYVFIIIHALMIIRFLSSIFYLLFTINDE